MKLLDYISGTTRPGSFSALSIILTAVLAVVFIISGPGGAGAEGFFEGHSTWYEKIPANPAVTPNSEFYVQTIVDNSPALATSYRDWSVPVFYARPDTPYVTVTGVSQSVIDRGWNVVPIPPEAQPAGNAAACAGTYRDGHMVVVSADGKWAWDLYRAQKCEGQQWYAYIIRKWDLGTEGVIDPYDGMGSAHVGRTPLLQGLITYDEIMNSTKIEHALQFATYREVHMDYWSIYPSREWKYFGQSSDLQCPWCPKVGMRLQLDPAVDCSALGLNDFGRKVCVALQEYGMIYVITAGPGNNAIYAESLDNKPETWSGIIGSLSAIPLNRLRVVEPVYPTTQPPAADTVAPSVPGGITAVAASSSQINLSWSASTDNAGVAGYKVFRNGVQIATTQATSYADAGLAASTSYTYKVAAYDAAGNTSAQSGQVTATTKAAPDTQAPSVPVLGAKAVSSTQISLSWSASADNVGVAGYKVYRDGVQIATTQATTYSDTGLVPSTSYTYRVAAYDAAGNTSAQSAAVSVGTTAAASQGYVVVKARGTYINGSWSKMDIWVNGARVQTLIVNSPIYVDYKVPVSGQVQKVDVVFTNDYYSSSKGDRNLYVSSVTANVVAKQPTASGVTYDRGSGTAAFDGRDVVSGRGDMLWNGALRFNFM